MLELPTVVKSAALDQSLVPVDVRVFLLASQLLSEATFESLPLIAIALPTGLDKSTVLRSLRRLCEQGYLERGPRDAGGAARYRMTPGLSSV